MQFSIRHLMAWTVVVSVTCGVLFAIPSWAGVTILGLGLLWLPVLLVCGVIYARGWRRTFFIGALISAGPFLVPLLLYLPIVVVSGGLSGLDLSELSFAGTNDSLAVLKFSIAAFFSYVICSGLAALVSRWLVAPREAAQRPPSALAAAPPYAVVHGRLVTEVIPQPATVDGRQG